MMKDAPEFLKFAAVGALGTLIHYVILLVSVTVFSVAAAFGAGLGALFGALFNYSLNHRLTFKSKTSHWDAGPKFLLLAVTSGVVNGSLVAVIMAINVHFFIAQIATTVVLLLINYLVSKVWVFKVLQ